MKKMIYVVLAAVMLFGTTSVSAMTKEELKDKLTKTYEVNGQKVSATSAQKAFIERVLEKNELTSDQLDFIAEKFEEALDLVEEGNATSVKELTQAEKNEILAIFDEIEEETGIKATVENGQLVVQNQDNSVDKISDEVVKYTDSSISFVTLAGAMSLAIAAAIALKVKKANA